MAKCCVEIPMNNQISQILRILKFITICDDVFLSNRFRVARCEEVKSGSPSMWATQGLSRDTMAFLTIIYTFVKVCCGLLFANSLPLNTLRSIFFGCYYQQTPSYTGSPLFTF